MEHNIIEGGYLKEVIELLEFKMAKGVEKDYILRLMILLSLTEGGLKEKQFYSLKKLYIECYGIEELHTLLNAEEKMKLFRKKQGKFDWEKIKREFTLINEEVDVENPIDISYVYSGYAPLSVKIIEYFLGGGFDQMQDSKFLKF